MPTYNSEIAEKFQRMADLLEIKGANRYRVRAYRRGAQTISRLSTNIEDMIKEEKDLTELPGIGEELARKIKEIIQTKTLLALEELKEEIPASLIALLDIEGLGPKRVQKLFQKLNIVSEKDLKKALKKGKVRELEGFGEKIEENIKEALKEQTKEERMLFIVAEEIVQPLIKYLEKDKNIDRVEVAGSYRRKKETIGDFDILAISSKGEKAIDRFTQYEDVDKIISQGETRSTVKLRTGVQVDLRVVPQKSFGAALLYFTGSKEHNIALRSLAMKKGYKLNEYGLFKKKTGKRVGGKTEKEIYDILELSMIPPEIRENRGEIKAAQEKKIPQLIKLKDIKGDLHMHTTNSDGTASIKEMVEMARELGWEYIAIADHSAYLGIMQGLNEKDLKKYIKKIKEIDNEFKDISVLAGCEVDILEDGSLFFPDNILKELDIVLCAVHSHFNLKPEKQTERIIRALKNKYVNILVHPTGRKIDIRKPYDFDMEKVMKAAKENNCFLEINSQPFRLDLNQRYTKMAMDMGLKLSINTDAHNPESLRNIKYGVYQARRGWLKAGDVINTLSLNKLKEIIKK